MLKVIQSPAKYLQGPDAAVLFGQYAKNLAESFFVIADDFVMKLAGEKVVNGLQSHDIRCHAERFNGECSHAEINRLMAILQKQGCRGVVGIGGLGHMGIKLAHAMGAHVVAFTTSESKRNAARALGADDVVVSRNDDEMAAHVKSFDFILNTVAAPHNLDAFTTLLKRDGTMTLVGAPTTPHPSPEVFNLIIRRRSIAGSMIGGIAETQEMLDFCAEHGIVADIELIRGDEINEAWERMVKGDVKYRFVIDSATLAG